jgi:hypothetical protein
VVSVLAMLRPMLSTRALALALIKNSNRSR